MRLAKYIGLSLSIAVMVLSSIGGMPAPVQAAEEVTPITYGGYITGADDVFVAVVVEGEDVTVYICDGIAEKGTASIAEWFLGKVKDNAVDVTGPTGNRVVVALTETTATGKFTFAAGGVKEFVLGLLPPGAGLFRSEFNFGGEDYVVGWVTLADGSVRGAARRKSDGALVAASFKVFAPYIEQDN